MTASVCVEASPGVPMTAIVRLAIAVHSRSGPTGAGARPRSCGIPATALAATSQRPPTRDPSRTSEGRYPTGKTRLSLIGKAIVIAASNAPADSECIVELTPDAVLRTEIDSACLSATELTDLIRRFTVVASREMASGWASTLPIPLRDNRSAILPRHRRRKDA